MQGSPIEALIKEKVQEYFDEYKTIFEAVNGFFDDENVRATSITLENDVVQPSRPVSRGVGGEVYVSEPEEDEE